MTHPDPLPVACTECGWIQTVPPLGPTERALCSRCGSVVLDLGRRRWANRMCAASALAALILYLPAIALPILIIERLGHRNVASIWKGVIQFLANGEYFVGGIVLVCSILVPLFKLLGLLLLVWHPRFLAARRKARLFRFIEWSGKWGMLDVLLIALLVAWVKMGDLVSIQPGPAVFSFSLMVFLSLVASACFDPKAIWDNTTQDPS
ncbi:MAG: paraquat-inducible protein A [Planctomycetes bacterium]|nr:paraquat-inducible protein A [Planctomycetota bacterium]MCB9911260.1 paraquat-inducible protein A [Planctomycetota bacterium]HPF13742.1 paraquat-inducible protein A [Planctomycetota bacterium]